MIDPTTEPDARSRSANIYKRQKPDLRHSNQQDTEQQLNNDTQIMNSGITSNRNDPNNKNTNNNNNNNNYCYQLVDKAVEINLVLNEPDIDLWRLREFALTEGGLVNGTFQLILFPNV
jgi:hypothetical protein